MINHKPINKLLTITVLSIVLLQSCKDELAKCPQCDFNCLDTNDINIHNNDCLDNWTCNYAIRDGAKIETKNEVEIVEGNNTVFEMHNSTEGELILADDEIAKILIFELDSEVSSFSATDSELENLNVHYRIGCYCLESDFKKVNTGCLQGELLQNGLWRIQGKLFVDYKHGIEEVKIDALFSR